METEHDGRTEVEVVTSTQEVFGDSDDSDVEEEEIIQQAPNSEPTGASMKDLFGSDNEDDDDDDSGDAEEPQNQSRSSAALKSRMRDVFGDESEDEATPEEDTPAPSSQLSTQDRDADQTTDMKTILGEDFEDEPPAEKTKTTSQLCLVRAPIFSSKDAHTLVKMPRSISIQDKCFDERTYDASTEAQMFSGASTVIRWRYMKDAQGNVRTDEHGEKLVESNARLVRYSDGSMQLIVGDAAFDTEMRPTQHSYVQAKSSVDPNHPEREVDTNAACFECAGLVTHKMSLKPSSLSSEAHKRTVAFYSKNERAAATKIRMGRLHIPEKSKESREREDDVRIRRERRLRSQTENRRAGYKRLSGVMSAEYLEEGADEGNYDTVNVSRMKSRVRQANYYDDEDEEMADFIVNDEEGEEDSEEGDRWLGSSNRGKKATHREREMDDDDDDEEDDDEDEAPIRKTAITSKVRVSAPEEEEEPAYQPKKRSKRAIDDEDD